MAGQAPLTAWGSNSNVILLGAIVFSSVGGVQQPFIFEDSGSFGDLCGGGIYNCSIGFGGPMSIAFQAKWKSKVPGGSVIINFGSSWNQDNIVISDNYTNNCLTATVYNEVVPSGAVGNCPNMVDTDDQWHYYLWTIESPAWVPTSTGGTPQDIQRFYKDGVTARCELISAYLPKAVPRAHLLIGNHLSGSNLHDFSGGFIEQLKVFAGAVDFLTAFPDWVECSQWDPRCFSVLQWILLALACVFCIGGVVAAAFSFQHHSARKGARRKGPSPRDYESEATDETVALQSDGEGGHDYDRYAEFDTAPSYGGMPQQQYQQPTYSRQRFSIGDQVLVRDSPDVQWIRGIVTASSPLRVRYATDDYRAVGRSFNFVEPVQSDEDYRDDGQFSLYQLGGGQYE